MSKQQTSNFVLHEKSKEFYWEGTGQLSIKTFTQGRAYYRTNRGFFAVEDNRYLLLNKGDYSIAIDEPNEVESFCVFFQEGFAEEVLKTVSLQTNQLLSDPFKEQSSIGFFEKTFELPSMLTNHLYKLKNKHKQFGRDAEFLEENYYNIMECILLEQTSSLKETEALSALKKGTREELYRRISLAHDFIRAYFYKDITLRDIANAAFLSPNHLLRSYSQIYKKTPHQHLTELRIERAKWLLKETDRNMTDITYDIGLHNPVSFSKMFKQFVGTSPSNYRKKVILDKQSK